MKGFHEAFEREYQRQLAFDLRRARQRAAALADDERKREIKRQERQEREARRPVPKQDRPICGAKTRAGGSCVMRAVPGKMRCRLHGGLSTGPKTAEGIERIRQAQAKRWGTANASP